MNCVVCILLLCALRRGGGGGGIRSRRDGNDVEWSGSQFLLRRGEGKTRMGGRRAFLMRDVEAQVMRSAEREVPACRGWFCHVAYMRTCRKGIEKHTPVLGPHRPHHGSDLHESTSGEAGHYYAMYLCTHTEKRWAMTHLYWTLVSITFDTNSTHLEVTAWCRICLVFAFTRQGRVVTLVCGADRRSMRDFLVW